MLVETGVSIHWPDADVDVDALGNSTTNNVLFSVHGVATFKMKVPNTWSAFIFKPMTSDLK